MNSLLDLLRDPVWQGMGVLVALFFSVVQTVRHRNKSAVALGVIGCLLLAVAAMRPSAGALATASFVAGTEAVCGQGEVVRVTLYVRVEPSDKTSILHTLRRGDKVDLICRRSVVLGGVTWTEIRSGNTVGWVAESVVGEPRPHLLRE